MRTYNRWTEERITLLRSEYVRARDLPALALRLGVTMKAMYTKAFTLGLERGQRRGTKDFILRKYSDEQFNLVRTRYSTVTNKTLSIVSGVHINVIKKWAKIHGWRKSERYYAECKEYTKKKRAGKRKEYYLRNRERVAEWNRRYRERRRLRRIEAEQDTTCGASRRESRE